MHVPPLPGLGVATQDHELARRADPARRWLGQRLGQGGRRRELKVVQPGELRRGGDRPRVHVARKQTHIDAVVADPLLEPRRVSLRGSL